MKIEDKAKAYDEMVQRVKELHETGNFLTKKQMEIICPELAESEDERIRREIANFIRRAIDRGSITKELRERSGTWLAYLEKQKVNTKGDFGRGYDCGYQAGYSVAMNEMKSKVATATLDSENQKEQKPTEEKLHNLNEAIKGLRMDGCERMADSLHSLYNILTKEQKPVDNEKVEITDFEQAVYDLCPVLGIEEAKATASDLLELAKKTLLKTGKVVLASNYPEGCSFEDGFHLGYSEGFNAKQEQKPAEYLDKDMVYAIMKKLHDLAFSQRILINSDEYKKIEEITSDVRSLLDYPIEQKPDEIDGKALLHVSNKSYKIGYRDGVDSVKPVEGEFPYNTPADTVEGEIDNIWSKLSCENKFTATKTGFREVILHFVNYVRSNAAPEWSEEDRLILDSIIAVVEEWEDTQSDKEKAYYGATTKSDWLKSLRPQPKQEWSEDDEMMVKSIVNVLKRFEHQGATDIKIDWLQNKLKSLRPSWKPSEEQMKALKDASDREFFSGYGATLRVLYSDLKKLI